MIESHRLNNKNKLLSLEDDFQQVDSYNKTGISNASSEVASLARKYQLIGVCSFILSGAMVKIAIANLNGSDFPGFVYNTIRLFTVTIVFYVMIRNNNEPRSLFQIKTSWMIIRSVLVLLSFLLYGYSIDYMKFGLVTLLHMTCPIVTNILFSFLFNIRLNMNYIYACILSLFGVYLIFHADVHETIEQDKYKLALGIIYSLLNSFIVALAYATVKILSTEFDNSNMIYISSFWATVISLVICLVFTPSKMIYFLNLNFVLCLSLSGVFSASGFYYVSLAITTADISKSSYINYLQLPALGLFGILLYGESYNIIEYLGFSIILVVSIYTTKYIN